jgi:8-oxo-dGTP diphosphatase
MRPIIQKNKTVEWELTTNRYIFPDDINIDSTNHRIRKLVPADARYIYENSHYQKVTSVKYIQERINKGASAGLVKNNSLVAWGLTHDDNALGFLHVMPRHRKQGFGKDITKFLIKRQRNNERSVFLNIESDNVKSSRLAEKIGFVYDRKISWFKIK